MSAPLSPANEAFIQDALLNGAFPTREALLNAAVESLQLQTDQSCLIPSEHRTAVEAGLRELDAGLGQPWNAEAFKQQMHARHNNQQAS